MRQVKHLLELPLFDLTGCSPFDSTRGELANARDVKRQQQQCLIYAATCTPSIKITGKASFVVTVNAAKQDRIRLGRTDCSWVAQEERAGCRPGAAGCS